MNTLPSFELEDYLSEREFTCKYMLCASDPETFSMAEILELASSEEKTLWHNLKLNYTEPAGHPLLRSEIACHYGQEINSGNILCFAGAEEGLYTVFKTILNTNDHAIVITPCYQSHLCIPKTICSVSEVALSYGNDWQLELNKIESAIQSNTRLIAINFPHNPTGSILNHAQQEDLIALCRKNDIWILSDEVYRNMELDSSNCTDPIASKYERGISLGVMSKAYGLAGLRIGWIACQDQSLIKQLLNYKFYLSITNSAPSEILALIALKNYKTILKRNMNLINSNLKLADQFFSRHANILAWIKPKGSCVGFPKFINCADTTAIANRLSSETGVLIAPGKLFGNYPQYFRIGFGRANFAQALDAFEKFMENL